MATNHSKKYQIVKLKFNVMLNLKINIQRKMCWQACNKWCNYLWFFSHFRLSIMMTLQGMTEKMFFHLLMFRPRRRTQTSKSLLQQNNEFPVYANCLLLILNFVSYSFEENNERSCYFHSVLVQHRQDSSIYLVFTLLPPKHWISYQESIMDIHVVECYPPIIQDFLMALE